MNPKYLDTRATAVRFFEDGTSQVRSRNWRREDHRDGPPRHWVGYTEFKLRTKEFEQHLRWDLLASKGGGEVHVKDIPVEEWPQWQIADGEEWSKVAASGAVRLMPLEESQEVERQLREAGTEKRILPSRVVRRWKPAEQPGEPPTMKSRWCIRGDRDPDYLNLDRYAPTVNTAIISVALQVAASKGWRCALGDLKNAFMQSDRLLRSSGRLFCRPPAEGLPGVSDGQLIEILAGAYGLGDAPAHWRKSLLRVLRDLGYEQSAMDPCTFKLFRNGALHGLVLVEVDDLLSIGDEVHYEQMQLLQQRFKFGKFKMLHEEANGASFNGRRLRATAEGGFLIDMKKFVEERLSEVPLSVGRKKEPDSPATSEERAAARAAIGSLTWAAKEGRPDCAAMASIIARSFKDLRVRDLCDLNRSIQEVKKRSDLSLQIQAIPLERLRFGVVTDASWANVEETHSQGAFGVLAFDQSLVEAGRGKANLLHWRSGKIHRVVSSTLAAETQALSKGMSELAWTVTVFNEMITHQFDLREWQDAVRQRGLYALAKEDISGELKQTLCVVDAKSLFDHLSKDTVGSTSDKRTTIEIQVVRQAMRESATVVKWIPHPRMIMDALTKRQGNQSPLIELLETGEFGIREVQTN